MAVSTQDRLKEIQQNWEKNGDLLSAVQDVLTVLVPNANFVLDGINENALIIKRTGTFGPNEHKDPIFSLGRIVTTGIDEPTIRLFYTDDGNIGSHPDQYKGQDVWIVGIEPSGTLSTNRILPGSHFEGFKVGDSQPRFRIEWFQNGDGTQNSSRIRFGEGGNVDNDVELARGLVPTGQQAPLLVALGGSVKHLTYPDAFFLVQGVDLALADNNGQPVRLIARDGEFIKSFGGVESPLGGSGYVPVPQFDAKTIIDKIPGITVTESFTGVFLDAVSSVTLVGDTDSTGVSASITNIDYDDLSVEMVLNGVSQGYTLTIVNPNGSDVYTFSSADIRGTGSAGTTVAEFDAGSSGVWINEGSLPFTLRPPGGTPSSNTGVLAAPSSFAYVEASGTVPGNTSIFRTADFAKATELSFNYHMFGATMGDLFVQYTPDGVNWSTVFTLSGQQQGVQADPYLNAVIDMSTYPALEIRLLYTNAQTFQADLCLDSLTLTSI